MRPTRRQVLRGAGGVLVGLPALESLTARASPPSPPKRFIGLFHANGVHTPQWFPTSVTSETSFTLGPIHQPLAEWKDHLLFTGGLSIAVAVTGLGEQHQRGVGALLTGAALGTGDFVGNDGSKAGYALGPSIDQVLVPLIGLGTPIPSLQLGVHALLPNVSGVVSYAGPSAPLLPQNDPHLTFRSLFLDAGTPPGELERIRVRRKSVLDSVAVELGVLGKRVSKADRVRLDRHLTLLRGLEARLGAIPVGTCAEPSDPGAIVFDSADQMGVVAQLQVDLLLLAVSCDLTRIGTLMLSDAQNHITMPHLGILKDVHALTHLSDTDPDRLLVATRDTWVSSLVARLLAGLNSIVEVDGTTALTNTLLLWGTDVSRGNVHAHDDMPFVLAGHGAGFRMGRYARWPGRNHNDLLLSIANGFGGTSTTFGTASFCQGPLPNLSSI